MHYKKRDKFKTYSYFCSLGYRGFFLQHQNPKKPLEQLPEEIFWLQNFPFLENTNIFFYQLGINRIWKRKRNFSKTYSNVAGKSNTYYGGYYKSHYAFTDDGHIQRLPDTEWKIKDKDGNHFAVFCI